VEGLEDRCLLAAPAVDPITFAPLNVPAGKTLFVPVTATDTDGNPLTYTATSSNPQISVTPRNNPHPYLDISVAGFGDMVFQLFDDLTPNSVAIVNGLVKSEFYNNLTFHRVVPNFVIQGGDPSGNGTGGPGFTFEDEFNASAIYSGNGQLGFANTGPDTNGSQFFVTLGPQRILDFNQAIFGQLVRGFDVLTKIDQVPTDSNNKPLTPVVISSAKIIQDTTATVLSFQAAAGATGSATITVTASDGKGGTSAQSFQVQAVSDSTDDPPFLNPVSNVTTPVNTPVTINLSATNINNDPLQFEAMVQGINPQATATVNGNVVTVTPNAGFTGPVQVLVGVAEQGATRRGSSSSLFDTHVITVGVGDLPLVATGTPVSATEGFPANGVTVATFIDQDPNPVASDFTASINWGDGQVSTGTVTLGTGGTLTVAGTNTYKEAGTFQVTTTITDRLGAIAKSTSTATVADAGLTSHGVSVSAATGVLLSNTLVATFTDTDPDGILSDYTASINWGDGTTSAGNITSPTNGMFNVLGTHTYSTAGTFTANVTITDINTAGDVAAGTSTAMSAVTVQQAVATTNQSYVTHLYQNLLGRAPDPQGLNSFSTALDQKTLSRTQVATAILTSNESRTHEIENLYQTLLHRQADPTGLNLSLSFLKSGGTLEQVRAVIVGSNEYFQSRSGSSNTSFLTNLYQDALGRAIDPVGQSLAGQALTAGMDRSKVAAVVFTSREGEQFLVQSYYSELLNRTADSVGMTDSTATLADGLSEEKIIIAISASDEYFNRA
jgi:cyclophilin family peptidyl-prolyl cis-trans isomerase